MSRGKKTPPDLVYKIMTSWAVTNSYSETAREVELPATTVETIVKRNKDKPEFVELRGEKKDEFAEKASNIIDKAMRRLEREIEAEGHIPINHLTTVIGTLFDKRALARGENTENMQVEIKLPEGIEEYAG